MRFPPIAFALTAILAVIACAGSEEDLPTNTPTPTPTSEWTDYTLHATSDAFITFCPQIGGAPTTPTPLPSCQPPASIGDLSGVSLQEADPPPLPAGLTAASAFYTVEGGAAGLPAQLSLDLLGDEFPGPLAWYTYDNEWKRLDFEVRPIGTAGHPVVFGTFDPLPANLIVLTEAP